MVGRATGSISAGLAWRQARSVLLTERTHRSNAAGDVSCLRSTRACSRQAARAGVHDQRGRIRLGGPCCRRAPGGARQCETDSGFDRGGFLAPPFCHKKVEKPPHWNRSMNYRVNCGIADSRGSVPLLADAHVPDDAFTGECSRNSVNEQRPAPTPPCRASPAAAPHAGRVPRGRGRAGPPACCLPG